jgi:hypothetical protein
VPFGAPVSAPQPGMDRADVLAQRNPLLLFLFLGLFLLR